MDQVTAIGNYLGIELKDIRYGNISSENLKTAVDIFVYLYFNIPSFYYTLDSCPFIEYNKWFSSWSPIYHDIFKTKSADKIILTLNRIITTNPSQSSKGKTEDVLKKISTTLALKHADIHNILPQKTRNSTMVGDHQFLQSSEGIRLLLSAKQTYIS